MFNPFSRNETPSNLDWTLSVLYSRLGSYETDTKEYANVIDQIVKLEKLKNETHSSWTPSPDAVIGAVASIGGILLIIHAEHLGSVTSKAIGFVRKATN